MTSHKKVSFENRIEIFLIFYIPQFILKSELRQQIPLISLLLKAHLETVCIGITVKCLSIIWYFIKYSRHFLFEQKNNQKHRLIFLT